MSLMQRLKRLLNKQIDNLYPKEVSILPNTSKYKNMTLFAPDRGMNADTFYLSALDENNNPIVDETIKIKIDDEIIEKQTNEYGNVIFLLDLDLGLYVAEVFFPNGEYSQSIETNIATLLQVIKLITAIETYKCDTFFFKIYNFSLCIHQTRVLPFWPFYIPIKVVIEIYEVIKSVLIPDGIADIIKFEIFPTPSNIAVIIPKRVHEWFVIIRINFRHATTGHVLAHIVIAGHDNHSASIPAKENVT